MLENHELQLTHKLQCLAYKSLTSLVTEQISDRCALRAPVNNSEENNKMLLQINLPVPVSHRNLSCSAITEAEEKNLEHLLGDFGGLWKIFFFNFWKRVRIFNVFKIFYSSKISDISSKLASIPILYEEHLF